MPWTTTDLLADIRRRALIPDAAADFTNAVLLAMANEQLETDVYPTLLDARAEYGVERLRVPIVAGQKRYLIPERAYLSQFRSLCFVDASGKAGAPLPEIGLEHSASQADRGAPYSALAYVPHDGSIYLVPTPVAGQVGYLLWEYYRRPGYLVDAADETLWHFVTSVVAGTVGGDLRINVQTAELGAVGVGSPLDIVRDTPPHTTELRDAVIAAVGATYYEVDSGLSEAGVAAVVADMTDSVGWALSRAYYTPYPQLPAELHHALAQSVATVVLEDIGDRQGAELSRERYAQIMGAALKRLARRNDGESKRIAPSTTTLRGGR